MAIAYMLASSACFVSMSALVKLLGDALPLPMLMLCRTLLALPFVYLAAVRTGPVRIRARGDLWRRVVFGALAMYCFYYALTHMALASCVFLSRTQPLWLAFLAPFLTRERMPASGWLAIGCGLGGVALILRPEGGFEPAAAAALGGALTSALAHLYVRRLNRSDRPAVIVFHFTLRLAAISALLAIPVWTWPTAQQWPILAGVAALASTGQYLLTKAYRLDQAPVVSASSYSSIVLSLLYGFVFWREVPAPTAVLGGLLVAAGGTILVLARRGRAEPLDGKGYD